MTNNHSALIALALAASTFAMGCGSPTSDGDVGAGHARLIMSNGGQPADLVVTARDDVSGSVSFQETVHLDANLTTVLVTDLPASTYTIEFEVLGEGATNAVIGASRAHTKLDAGVTTEIKVNTAVNADGNGATVNVDVNEAPQVHEVSVRVVDDDTKVEVHVDATDGEDSSDKLLFFWTGAGLEGVVQGSSTIDLPIQAVKDGSLHLVIVDSKGASVSIDIAVEVDGDMKANVSTSDDMSNETCLQGKAACLSRCEVALGASLDPLATVAHAACVSTCNVELATCEAG